MATHVLIRMKGYPARHSNHVPCLNGLNGRTAFGWRQVSPSWHKPRSLPRPLWGFGGNSGGAVAGRLSQTPPEIAGHGESTSLIIVDLESSGFAYPKIIVGLNHERIGKILKIGNSTICLS